MNGFKMMMRETKIAVWVTPSSHKRMLSMSFNLMIQIRPLWFTPQQHAISIYWKTNYRISKVHMMLMDIRRILPIRFQIHIFKLLRISILVRCTSTIIKIKSQCTCQLFPSSRYPISIRGINMHSQLVGVWIISKIMDTHFFKGRIPI